MPNSRASVSLCCPFNRIALERSPIAICNGVDLRRVPSLAETGEPIFGTGHFDMLHVGNLSDREVPWTGGLLIHQIMQGPAGRHRVVQGHSVA